METVKQQSENSTIESATEQKEFMTPKTVTAKPLKDWGYTEAGLNQGDPMAFESRLRWIKAGHVVDESYDVDEELRRKKQLEAEIIGKEREKNGKEKDQQHIKEVIIPDKENQIKQQKSSIEQKQILLAEGKIQSLYNPAKFWLYSILGGVISIYLIFFYASAMNASFFRNMQQMVNNSSGDDVSLMLNSIFDAKGIFQGSAHLLFVYLGAFLFFGFGTLPHIFHDGSKWQWLKICLATLVCLSIDGLIAYKIDSGIHELKTMMGIADANWAWYKSVNFYLVLAFGFGTYILWGFIYEAAIKEHGKKNINTKAEIEIKAIRKRIREVENEIIKHKQEVSDLQKLVDAFRSTIENLKKDLETALTKPETLLRNMENFYAGWLHYLNGSNSNDSKKITCENIYRNFHQTLSVTPDNLN
ncbi:MAG: hypothetical protein V4722_14155 [Bacteroidota bacterium]